MSGVFTTETGPRVITTSFPNEPSRAEIDRQHHPATPNSRMPDDRMQGLPKKGALITTQFNLPSDAPSPSGLPHSELSESTASRRSNDIAARRDSRTPETNKEIKARQKIDSWFAQKQKEDDAAALIDTKKLQRISKEIQSIHDHKRFPSLIPDLGATHAYRKKADDFLDALGVSAKEKTRAKLSWGVSGEYYALAQIPIFPLRLIPGMSFFGKLSVPGQQAVMGARGALHANCGAVLQPMFDVLADLGKDGMPVPGDYWKTGTRNEVTDSYEKTLELTERVFELAKKNNIAVPECIVEDLELARQQYKHNNAKAFVFTAAGMVSQVAEFIKTSLDTVVGAASAHLQPLVRAATNASTAALYVVTSPFEEIAAYDQICVQNAKYASILNKDGTVNVDKAKGLWARKRQVEAGYIELAAKRHISQSLHQIQNSKGRVEFLREYQSQPNKKRAELFEKMVANEKQAEWLKQCIESLKPAVGKEQALNVKLVLDLWKTHSRDPQASTTILDEMCRQHLQDILKEHAKYPDNPEFARLATHAAGVSETPSNIDPADRDSINAFQSFIYRACNGKHLLQSLEHQYEYTRDQGGLLKEMYDASQAGGHGLPPSAQKKLQNEIDAHSAIIQSHTRKLTELVDDLAAFKAGRANELNKDGLIAGMLTSGLALRWEAIKAKYSEPGILAARMGERAAFAASLSAVLMLGSATADGKSDGPPVLGWHSPVTVLPGSPGNTTLAADFVTTAGLNLTVQQMMNSQSERSATSKNTMPAQFSPHLDSALKEIAGFTDEKLNSLNLHDVDLGFFPNKYGVGPEHPEKEHDRVNRGINHVATVMRNAEHQALNTLRWPMDMAKGMKINRDAKKTLEKIRTYNAGVPNNNGEHAKAPVANQSEDPVITYL